MYSGICPCGGRLKDQSHIVKTLKAAQEWFSAIVESDLPILIIQRVCESCGKLDKDWQSLEPDGDGWKGGYWSRADDKVTFHAFVQLP